MTVWERIDEVLDTQLLILSGVPVTVASLATCLVIFIVGLIVARVARSSVRRAIVSRGRSPGAASAAGKVAYYTIVGIFSFVSLDTLGFNLTALLAGSAVLLVGIGFGLQNIAQNFISGIILLLERPIKEGDFIRVGEIFGEVKHIGLRATHVISRDAVTMIVPNSDLVTSQVINLSVPTTSVRINVGVGVAYGSDTQLVQKLLFDVAVNDTDVLPKPAPEIRFDGFGDSSLDFTVLAWIAEPPDDLRVKSRLRFAIDKAFRDHGVTIPFPQRDLHIKSGLDPKAVN